MNRIIPVFMSILLILILSVRGKYFMRSLEHKENQDINIIRNENNPQGPPINLKFEEDLSLSRKAWFPTALFVDEKENIYIYLDKEQLLKKFNPKGIEITSKRISKGQGPGQFKHFV
jgi:hypothetical protein